MPPRFDPEVGCVIPDPGDWPVDPQGDIEIADDRLWIDGCFDFFHHGHAGVMLKSRRIGNELLVGLHSDEDIAVNKGPTVMNLAERVAAVEACRFSTKCVPYAPYVTSLPWISHYGCRFVAHGDDISSDASGNDCYRFVKKARRMKIVPRTPGISTTDLVGRMLLCTKDHFIRSLANRIDGEEGEGSEGTRMERGTNMKKMIREYAAAANGKDPYVSVYSFKSNYSSPERRRSSVNTNGTQHHHLQDAGKGTFTPMVPGLAPRPGQRVSYVDGGFDLFSSGHITFLKQVTEIEDRICRDRGWNKPEAAQERIDQYGEDYPSAYIVAGIHDDAVINDYKGLNYPIMNIFERGLCVTQCRYVHAVVFGAPYVPSKAYFASIAATFPSGHSPEQQFPDAVYHGPTAYVPSPSTPDPYVDAKALGIFTETPEHAFPDVNAAQIVQRILDRRAEYEQRQRKKGAKAVGEGVLRREEMERQAEEERLRRLREVEAQFGA